MTSAIKEMQRTYPDCGLVHIPTPDYEGGLETGYAKAVEALLQFTVHSSRFTERQINVLAGSHLTPTDFTELREIIESFGLTPIMLPDLSALDGSRQGFSALALGGTTMDDIRAMGSSGFTIAIGASMESASMILKERFGIEYRVFESISELKDTDMFMETISMLSGHSVHKKYERQRRILIDGMRDAHFYFSGKKICVALEPDLSMQTAHWLEEMGAEIEIVDTNSGDLFSIFSMQGDFDLLISNSHAEDTAKRLDVPLYQMGFPVYKVLGNNHKVTIGYRGTFGLINDIANVLVGVH